MNPSSLAFGSVALIVGSTILRRMREDSWKGHVLETVVYGFLLLIALLILALTIPVAAVVLSYLGIVGAFAVNGPAVFDFVGNFGRDVKH